MKDFVSDRSKDRFSKDTILQFQSSNTNVYDCIEILEFIDWANLRKEKLLLIRLWRENERVLIEMPVRKKARCYSQHRA